MRERDWSAGFDDTYTAGVACLSCGAIVAPSPEMVQRHRAFHEALEAPEAERAETADPVR